jgi:hypothetical protein
METKKAAPKPRKPTAAALAKTAKLEAMVEDVKVETKPVLKSSPLKRKVPMKKVKKEES